MKIIKQNTPNTISICEEDIEKHYLELPSDMDNFNRCYDLIQLYNENKILFGNINSCLHDIKNEPNYYIFEQIYDKVRIAINAFLGNLQPFLSTIRKRIDKTAFETITHNVYDHSIEYQFCYDLRNVLQHKGSDFYTSLKNNTDVKVIIDKKDILEDIKIKAKTKVLLNNYPDNIELIKELNGFYNAECEILKKAYLEIFNIDSHTRLLTFHTQNADNRFLYIGDSIRSVNDDNKEVVKFKFQYFDKQKILSNIAFYEDVQKQLT